MDLMFLCWQGDEMSHLLHFMSNITLYNLQGLIHETWPVHHVKTSFSQISEKVKVLEYMFVHNTYIIVVFPHLLSPRSTLCDLQEPRYKIPGLQSGRGCFRDFA